MLRRAAELARARHAQLIGVCVRDPSGLTATARGHEPAQRFEQMLAEHSGRYVEVAGTDIALTLAGFATAEQAGLVVIGESSHSGRHRFTHGSIARRTLRLLDSTEVYVVPGSTPEIQGLSDRPAGRFGPVPLRARLLGKSVRRERPALPPRRRLFAWLWAVVGPIGFLAVLSPARASIGLAGALVCGLLTIVLAAWAGGLRTALTATVLAVLSADFLFTVPYYSLRVGRLIDVLALVVFAIVGAVVGVPVDAVAGQARQSVRFQTEADALARLSARTLVSPSTGPSDVVGELREVFDLDEVGILVEDDAGWRVEAGAGDRLPPEPDAARFAAQIGPNRVLVLDGDGLTAPDAHLIGVFTEELLLAQRSLRQSELEGSTGGRR